MAMLQVVTGIIFVLLLLSLLATTIMEFLAGFLSLRGKNLEKALTNMLASTKVDDEILAAFKNNSLYRQLSYRFGNSQRAPSYVSDEAFQSILFDVLLKGEGVEKLKEKIDELPDSDLKKVLRQLLQDADNKLDHFKGSIKGWYNDVMDRASGWYKRSTQKILVGLGLVIAVVFNADTLAIYNRLEADPQALQQIVALADEFVEKNGEEWVNTIDPQFQQSYDELKDLISGQINAVKSPLGLGWKNVDVAGISPADWGVKVLGWLVTALAISLGAPFWFDLLRKIVNIRQAGNKS